MEADKFHYMYMDIKKIMHSKNNMEQKRKESSSFVKAEFRL